MHFRLGKDAMANRDRFKKRSYLRFFAPNAGGEYTYTGGYYALKGGVYGAYAVRLVVFTAIASVCAVLSGVLDLPGMKNSFYLIIPFISEVGFTGSVVWGAVKYFANAKPLREYVYTATAGAFHRRALLSAVFAGVGVVSETVFLILSGEKGQAFAAAGFYLLKAAVIISMLLLRHFVRGAEWTLSAAQTKR